MRLSAHDASFLYGETTSGPMHATAVLVLEGHLSFQQVFDFFAARIHLVPRLRQKVAYVPFNVAHPKWVDDPDFDLSNHLLPHKVPPGTTLNEALDIAMKLGEPLLDRSRPLWLFYVLENVEDKTLVVQISHHAFVDGATAVAMSTVLTDAESDAEPPEPPEPWNPQPVPSDMTLWQEAIREQAQNTVSAFQRGLPSMEMTGKVAALMARMAQPVMLAPWNAGAVGPQRRLEPLNYTLDEFKQLRKAIGGTMNDIALTAVVEGVARYMAYKGENTQGRQLRLMCPVNVRDENDDPLDMSGNKVSGMFPILDASPKPITERFDEVKAEMEGLKERDEAETMAYLQEVQPPIPPMAMTATRGVGTAFDPTLLAARIPAPILPNTGNRPQQAGFNFTFTNVMGPPWTQYIAGHEVLNSYAALMLSGNLGLGASLASFNGVMTFSFTVDPRLLPDVEVLRDYVAEAFSELQALAETSE